MRGKTPSFVLVGALALAAVLWNPSSIDGQNVPAVGNDYRPSGLWWELSLSAVNSRLSCSLCDPDREAGPAADLAVGAYASPRLRVGVQGGAWTHDDDGARETVYRAGVIAQLHLRPGSGLHVLGGLGWSGYRAGVFGSDTGRMSIGAGWDLPLAEGWLVGNHLVLDASAFGSLKNEETTVARGVGISAVRVGVYLRKR